MKKNRLFYECDFHCLMKTFRIMRITVFLLLASILQTFANDAYSQQTRLSLNFSNTKLVDALDEIEELSEFYFLYNEKLVDTDREVSMSFENDKISEILNKLFAETDMVYTIIDRKIILAPAFLSDNNQQQKTITGTVTDENSQPLPGVTVIIKGTTNGTVTNMDGNYSISGYPEDATLVFSFVGMKTQEIPVAGKTNINVILAEDAIGIEEVIAIGYGTMKKSDLTGAVSSIKVDELPSGTNASIEQMLAGRAAGMHIQANDAQPGGGFSILIRGAASTGAGNEPLYIIDGFPLSSGGVDPSTGSRYAIGSRSPLNSINPNDIQSVEILKDASATAIYGARAANGVILITTKTGEKGKVKVSYDFKQSVQKIANTWDVFDASEWMNAHNNYRKEKWMIDNEIGIYGDTDESSVSPWIPAHTDSEIAQAGKGTDWVEEVTRLGKIQEHNVSISGATDETIYLMSMNSYDQKGVIKENNFNRISGRLNIEQKVRDWVKVGVRATGSRINIDNPALGTGGVRGIENSGIIEAAIAFTPTLPVRDENGDYSFIPTNPAYPNPVSLLDITNNTVQDRLFVQSYLELEPLKNLKIRSQVGFDKQEGVTRLYVPKTTIYGASYNGMARITQNNKFDKLFNTTISYTKEIADGHNLSGLLGYEFQEFNWDGYSTGNTNFSTDAFLYNNLGAGQSEKPRAQSYKGIDMLASYFGRVNYNVKDKYLITITMRADGSTKFGDGNKFGYFPSGAIAWRVINEDFMKELDWISNLKLRLSAGQTGNSNISGAFAYYAFGTNYLFGGTKNSGTYLFSYANDDLKWETTTEYNLGLDFGFFNNRINGSLELYTKEVSDLLGVRQLRTYLVKDEIAANLGTTSSKGYELSINTINTQGVIRWTTNITLSSFHDRWKERSEDVILASFESETDPLRPIWGFETDGLVQPGENIPHMPGAVAGVYKIKDINGYDDENNLTGSPDGIINNADVVMIGSYDPDIIFGFTNSFEYKNFDLNMHVYSVVGRTKANDYLRMSSNLSQFENGLNYPVIINDFYSSENIDAKLPNNNVTNPFLTGDMASQPYLQESSFVRVKNITLGYTMPNNMLNSFFKKARVYVNVSNPFLFTKFTGIDPEYESGSGGKYPSQMTFTLGVSLEF